MRELMTMHKSFHSRNDVDRQNVTRKRGRRRLTNIKDCVDVTIQWLKEYTKRAKRLTSAASNSNKRTLWWREKQELLNQENKNGKKNIFVDTSESKLRKLHTMGFYLVPYCQPSPPTQFLPIGMCHFCRLWNGMFGRVKGQYTTKWSSSFLSKVLLCISNNSIKHQSFVYTHLNVKAVLFLTIQLSISYLLAHSLNVKQFYLIHR